jgi:chromate transporter
VSDPKSRVLREIAGTFLRLGLTAFGGPAGHIALMRDEFVRRRGWLDDPTFVDLIGAANLIPGPTSTELAMHIGHRRAGRAGLVVAGLAFVLPAVVMVAVLAWVYVQYGRPTQVGALLDGIAPVVVAIVAHAGWSIARSALRGPFQIAVLAGAIVAVLFGTSEIAVLLGAGVLAVVARAGLGRGPLAIAIAGWTSPWTAVTVAVTGSVAAPLLIFGVFLKIGAVLFGSGYVLVALLRSELVEGLGWITETQLLDAIAVGQATPGPLFSTATFIGYLVGGPSGAIAATVGVFLPAFLAVALSIPVLDHLRDSVRARAFLDGVNAAAVGLLAVVAAQLALASIRDVGGAATVALAFVLLIRGVGTGWLIAAGAALGLVRLVWAPV